MGLSGGGDMIFKLYVEGFGWEEMVAGLTIRVFFFFFLLMGYQTNYCIVWYDDSCTQMESSTTLELSCCSILQEMERVWIWVCVR